MKKSGEQAVIKSEADKENPAEHHEGTVGELNTCTPSPWQV